MKSPLMVSSITLIAIPNAVAIARCFVSINLCKWGRRELSEDAELLASELVTNAIKATGIIHNPSWSELYDRTHKVRVCLVGMADSVIIEVWDSSSARPVMLERPADSFEEGGRGLFLIGALSKTWGYREHRSGGKTVWCQLSAV